MSQTQTRNRTRKYAWAGQVIVNPSQAWLDRWAELVLQGAVEDGDLVEVE